MNPNNAFAQVVESGNAHGRARDYLLRQISEDDPAFADTLEGMTELPEMIDRIMLHARTRKAEAEGLKPLIAELTERMKAGQEYEAKARAAVLEAMKAAGEKTIRAQTGTYTVTTTPEKIDIPDADSVPTEFCKQIIKYVPDREKIATLLDAGTPVNWALKLPAGTTLTVRKK